MKVQLPPSLAIDAEIDLGTSDGTYGLAARLTVSLPGVERNIAQQLISAAHETCPYSCATRGNVPVDIQLA
jgi:organic hydroperoxide reductase OsmC/OhrA